MRKNFLLLISFVLLFSLTGAGSYDKQNYNDNKKTAREITTKTSTMKPKKKELSTVQTPKERTLTSMYVSTMKGLNIREFASIESDIIDAVPVNTELQIYDDFLLDDWYMVKFQEQDYYVNKNYLSSEKVEIINPTIKKTNNSFNNIVSSNSIYSASQFKSAGVINWNGWRWTWYSQNVLPGGGLNIPGRYVDSSGFVCDGDGYICLAASSLSKGSIVSTPFGKDGKVYDSGCAAGTLDVYTNF